MPSHRRNHISGVYSQPHGGTAHTPFIMSDGSPKRPRAEEKISVPFKPAGYHTVTPYICVKSGSVALKLYAEAFGAVELMRMPGPDDAVMHAEFSIGDSHIMLSDEFPSMDTFSPEHYKGSPCTLMIYAEDCDAMFERAIAAGCTEFRPLKDQFYGDRSGTVKDPFGHRWTIATHIEDVSPEEMGKRMAAWSPDECDEKN
eukprot:m.283780 g.283780  ORF g.283780 m.283780 type:complete len:200 (-) comp27009_c1_seq2:171-770(-)